MARKELSTRLLGVILRARRFARSLVGNVGHLSRFLEIYLRVWWSNLRFYGNFLGKTGVSLEPRDNGHG